MKGGTMSESWDVKAFNAKVIAEFRANGGEVSSLPAANPLLLLTTTGARSGQKRTSPLGFIVEADRYYINGAFRGAPRHPAWYHNLLAHQDVTVEVGTDTFDATARVLVGDERWRIWDRFLARIPTLTTWQETTPRVFPIAELTRKT
jgi:deazaflavin-dependent oxidoreductase (nitroreductase family)